MLAVLGTLEEPEWSLPTNFGDVKDVNGYVIDPYFFKKTIDAEGFKNQDKYYEHFACDYSNGGGVKWNSFNAAKQDPDYKTAYCLENCTLAPAQKNGYSTGVLIKAIMEPYNNVYHLNSAGNLEVLTDKSSYPETLYYFDYRFYDSADALTAAVVSTAGVCRGTQQSLPYAYHRCFGPWRRNAGNNSRHARRG